MKLDGSGLIVLPVAEINVRLIAKMNDLANDRFPIGTKAIIMYSEDMLQKWCPYEVDLIFQYGNV